MSSSDDALCPKATNDTESVSNKSAAACIVYRCRATAEELYPGAPCVRVYRLNKVVIVLFSRSLPVVVASRGAWTDAGRMPDDSMRPAGHQKTRAKATLAGNSKETKRDLLKRRQYAL